MELSELVKRHLEGKNDAEITLNKTADQILYEDESRLLVSDHRIEFHNLLGINCWVLNDEGILSVSMESLNPGVHRKSRFEIAEKEQTFYHSHGYTELAYIASGELRLNVGGREETFREGEICLIHKECRHAETLRRRELVVIYIMISDVFFDRVVTHHRDEHPADLNSILRNILHRKEEGYNYIRFMPGKGSLSIPGILGIILNEMWNQQAGSEEIIRGYVQRILFLLPSEYQISLSRNDQSRLRPLLFREVSAYIGDHYRKISIKKLTEVFHYNEDFFNQLLKQYAGKTYSKYVQNVRLEKAADLLVTSDMPVESIAHSVGYANLGFFYKIFRERYGITPHQYRKRS